MTFTRREFLAGSSAVAFGLGMPAVFSRAALAAPKSDRPGAKETILVVVEMTGGNDGLNTVIPYKDPEYAKARPTLAQPRGEVKKINDELAFHPAMEGFSELLDDSRLAIVQGVGYPNPNRSHFSSMDIWHKAGRSEDEQFGWLGRAAGRLGGSGTSLYVGGGEGPPALFGTTGHAPTLRSLEEYQMRVSSSGDDPQKRALIEKFASSGSASGGELLELVRQSVRETYKSAERLRKAAGQYNTSVNYPATGLAGRLKLIAQLIDAGVPERIFYTSQGGYDTHSAQAEQHAELLQELAGAMAAFQRDLKEHGHSKRTLVMTFSEFGRRVRENGSRGTDHGAASQMFLAGETVKPGPLGAHPSLTDLARGDLKFHTDFRSVYATLLEQWLGVPAEPILKQEYPLLELLRKPAETG